MSSIEYGDLYYRAQENEHARYHMFTFDLVKSSEMNREDLCNSEYLLRKITQEVYDILKEKEERENKKILVFEEGFKTREELRTSPLDGFGFKFEPFVLGDMTGFTIYRDSLTREEVLFIFDSIKEKYDYEYSLHYADGYYETNDYAEGGTLFFRGYSVDILSNIHKPYMIKELKTF